MAAYDAEVDEAQRRMAELEAENQALRGTQAQQHHHIQQINQQNMNLAMAVWGTRRDTYRSGQRILGEVCNAGCKT